VAVATIASIRPNALRMLSFPGTRKGIIGDVRIAAPSHLKLTEIVTRVERGEVKPSPALLGS